MLENIEKICEKYKIKNYTINDDGSIVDLSKCELTELPLNFNRVNGSFLCYNNELTTLKGSPKYIKSSFDCSENKLTSLEYSPEYVGNHFYCNQNKLTSLEYSPKHVGGYLSCSYNKIRDLYGVSDYIEDYLWIYGKNPISSIFGKVVYIDDIKRFNSYKVIKDGIVDLKRLKYFMKLSDMGYDLEIIKKHYEII